MIAFLLWVASYYHFNSLLKESLTWSFGILSLFDVTIVQVQKSFTKKNNFEIK
jgi:hypothetical protein